MNYQIDTPLRLIRRHQAQLARLQLSPETQGQAFTEA